MLKVLFFARRGSDHEALSGQFLGVLAADHAPELKPSANLPRVYLAKGANFAGLLEGIRAYQFDASIRVPESASGLEPDGEASRESVLSPDVVANSDEAD